MDFGQIHFSHKISLKIKFKSKDYTLTFNFNQAMWI